jgi:hypothetical protein
MAIAKNKEPKTGKQASKLGASYGISLTTTGDMSASKPSSGKMMSFTPTVMKGIIARKGAAKEVLSSLGRAVLQAEKSGKPIRMTVLIEPAATSPQIAVEEISVPTSDALDVALAAARTRGAARVADILNGKDMLSADAFAEEIGATRETVHKKRRRHEVLGLDGPKRGVRFPKWQLSSSGELLPSLPALFQTLGEHPWAIYRFLLQEHSELDGSTALDALRQGRVKEVLAVAEALDSGTFA